MSKTPKTRTALGVPRVPTKLQKAASYVTWAKHYMLHELSVVSLVRWELPATPHLHEAVRKYNEAVINVRIELDIAYKLYKEQVLIRREWEADVAAKTKDN